MLQEGRLAMGCFRDEIEGIPIWEMLVIICIVLGVSQIHACRVRMAEQPAAEVEEVPAGVATFPRGMK